MILSDPSTFSFKRTAPRGLLILGALSLPFLPALASGRPTFAAAPVAAVQVPSRDQPAGSLTTPVQTDRKPNAATAPRDQQAGPKAPAAPRDALALWRMVLGGRAALAAPQEKVRVTQPIVREVSDYEVFVGHIVAAREAALRARVSGTVNQVDCRPGQVVKRGERLFQIDPRPYKVALDKASAELARAMARQKRCQIEMASVKHNRETKVVSQNEVHLFETQLLEADAGVKAAEAAQDDAKLNLNFTDVRAPFDGSISGPVLGLGNTAVADTTLLATIVSTDHMLVAFDVDERTVLHLNRLSRESKFNGGELVGLPVMIALSDEQDFPRRGKIESVETRIDAATGTAHWRALIPDPDRLLIPGLFVRVRLVTSAPHKGLMVPEQAMRGDGGQSFVFTVTDQGIVQKRPVKTRAVYTGLWSVEGLQADEWVAIDHLNRIKEGAKVVSERVPPPAEPSR
jgi:RND family efflux transporter MFP subunit